MISRHFLAKIRLHNVNSNEEIQLGVVQKLHGNKILAFFDNQPPCVDIFYGMNVDKCGHFWTTYLPRHVNVVCERPLT